MKGRGVTAAVWWRMKGKGAYTNGGAKGKRKCLTVICVQVLRIGGQTPSFLTLETPAADNCKAPSEGLAEGTGQNNRVKMDICCLGQLLGHPATALRTAFLNMMLLHVSWSRSLATAIFFFFF